MQSQGVPKQVMNTIQVVPKEIDEMNQTMPISIQPNKKKAETIETTSIIPIGKSREGGSEVPKNRRENALISVGEKSRFSNGSGSVAPPTTTHGRGDKTKGDILRSRISKQSNSPDKYTINNSLVVQLADPIRKPLPDTKAKMYQT